ncbi:glycosyl hydrolase family 18 protein [Motilimonas pumila]|uniref:GH18 domain-containing protein n=1 Tax=Motilimonas pumila TaxID=2303987 RepID=A0A418YDG3_9GAMM|nr:glycosyl hydrolase family 18 protein [Motilimonas pumila]RJG42541.1 hypothetical protein D1Z90_12825 [Motilimonas pumila]
MSHTSQSHSQAVLAAYFPMWHDHLQWQVNCQHGLSQVPHYINHLILSFVAPNVSYKGDTTTLVSDVFFEGEDKGLTNTASIADLAACIASYRQRCKSSKIIVSVGGEIGGEFEQINGEDLTRLLTDLDLDGIDIDYEPSGLMTATPRQIQRYKTIIARLRHHLDSLTLCTQKHYLLTCAPTGVGVFDASNELTILGVNEPSLNRYQQRQFTHIAENFESEIKALDQLLSPAQCGQENTIGEWGDAQDLKQPGECHVGTLASAYQFPSSGKMLPVYLAKNDGKLCDKLRYPYIGNMLDMVIYQAYNMGSANLLARVLCYQGHKDVSRFLANASPNAEGFKVVHGNHVGKEAWPQYAHTQERLSILCQYIMRCDHNDGMSFWSYTSVAQDDSVFVPPAGLGYDSPAQAFKQVANDLRLL